MIGAILYLQNIRDIVNCGTRLRGKFNRLIQTLHFIHQTVDERDSDFVVA